MLEVDGAVAGGSAQPLDQEQGLAVADGEGLGHVQIGRCGRDAVAAGIGRNLVFTLQNPVDGVDREIVAFEELRVVGREPGPVEGDRLPVSEPEAIQPEDRGGGCNPEPFGNAGGGRLMGTVENLRGGLEPRPPHVLGEIRQADESLGDPAVGYEGAESLSTIDEPVCLQRLEGPPHRETAHIELTADLVLGGELFIRLEVAVPNAILQPRRDLLVERRSGTEGCTGIVSRCRHEGEAMRYFLARQDLLSHVSTGGQRFRPRVPVSRRRPAFSPSTGAENR